MHLAGDVGVGPLDGVDDEVCLGQGEGGAPGADVDGDGFRVGHFLDAEGSKGRLSE